MTTNNGKLTIDEVDYYKVISDLKKEFGNKKVNEIIKRNINEVEKTWIHYAQIAVSENLSGEEDDLDRSTIGTLLAAANEYFQRDYVNEHTNIKLYDRDEKDNNGPGFDHLTEAKLRCQGKFRGGKAGGIEIQNNRRSNGINEDTSKKTGKVPYRITEFDIALITLPIDKNAINYEDLSQWIVIAIPITALVDLDNPEYCIPSLPAKGNKHKMRRPFPVTLECLFEFGAVSKYGYEIYKNRIAEVLEYAEANIDTIKNI